MPVWWGSFAYAMIVSIIGMFMYKRKTASATIEPVDENKTEQYKSIGLFFALASFALLVFFVGNRSVIHDTQEYQYMYDIYYNDDLSQITDIISGKIKAKGSLFAIYMVLFKHFTHGTYTDWFFSIAIFQVISLAIFFYRYSVNYTYSIFLFFASCGFLWLVNGMRQYLAVTLVLFFSNYIFKRKFIPFLLVVLIAFFIHSASIVWLPIYFIVVFKPWSYRFNISVVIFIVAVILLSKSSLLNDTDYSYMSSSVFSGINPFRLVISSIPLVLAFYKRDEIAKRSDNVMNIVLNISVVSTGCYIIGMFTNGVVTRLVAYFDIFQFVLLPWLLFKIFDEKLGKSITYFSIIGYLAYFFYNMYSARNGVYISDVLGLNFWMF